MDPTDHQLLLSIAPELATIADLPDPLTRARRAEELIRAVQSTVVQALADVRRDAIAELVAAHGAAATAQQLGISRARVYALVDGRGAVKTTRPRRASTEDTPDA